MDKFPDDFSWVIGNEKLTKNQTELIKLVRKSFYEQYIKSIEDCERQVTFKFPDKLWKEHRLQIIEEVLEKFGKIKLATVGSQHNTIKLISNMQESIPDKITSITIEFVKE